MATSRITHKPKRSILQMKNQMVERVMETELGELTRVKRWLHSALKIVVMVWQDFFHNLVKLQAMALAFKTLLSLAPLLAVLFSILKAFGVHNRMEPALAEALAPLGEKGREITAYLIGFVDKMSAGALGAAGLVALLHYRAVVDGQHRRRLQSYLAGARGAHADAQIQRLFERYTGRAGVGVRGR